MLKKTKTQKAPEQQQEKLDPTKLQKKHKSKKKKKQPKDPQLKKQQDNKQKTLSTPTKTDKQTPIKQQKNLRETYELTKSEDQATDLELKQLQIDGFLSPNIQVCKSINQKLEQLTINLFQTMIMKQSFLYDTIKLAQISKLTPNQYFFLDYTNKLVLIQKKLKQISANKYAKYIKKINKEINRVMKLILRSMENFSIFEDVFDDLKKHNRQLMPNLEFFD